MKKLMVVPFVLLASLAFGQISLGLKGGVNISNFTGGDFNTVKKEALVGFHVGGLLHWRIAHHIVLEPELLYSTQGAKLTSGNTQTDYKLNYVTIPLMIQYEADGGFYIEAGPQFGFKTGDKFPDSLAVQNSDFSVDAGLGYHSNKGFGIGARYVVGISKVGNFDASNINPDFKNSVIQISLFYTFFNTKKAHEKEQQ